jgi:hypothetical protein
MKKLLTLSLVLFFCGAMQAQNESLTFRVDVNNISSLSPNGIHVAGNWQSEANGDADWVPGANALDDSDEDGVYELTVQVPAGSYEYKFINGNDWSENPEGVPGECAINGNRGVDVVSGGVITDLVCFGSCAECPITGGGDVNVTFSVDGSQLGSIDPSGIHIAGTFNGFSPEAMTDAGGGVYTFTALVPSNTTVLYKYTNSTDFSGAESVPSECGQDDGFGGNNRFLDVAEADVTLPTVCFSACSECTDPGVSYELTLLVDASQLASINAAGLHAAGTFNGFSPAAMVDEGAGLYSITATVEEGSTVLWKYINGPTFGDEVESVPGACGADDGFGGFNRILTMPSADTTAGPVCFAQCVACNAAPTDYMLTLSVDASDLAEINPLGGIHVAGTFNGFSPASMNDDGDGVYSLSFMVAEGSNVLYKFLNSPNFDAAENVPEACGQDDGFGGFNRPLTMPSADTSASLVCFSSCEACSAAPVCELPYPQVTGTSFSNENGGILLSWNPIEGSIGCQLQFQLPNGSITSRIKPGANVSNFFIPGNLLINGGTYGWRVRCGCSQTPLIAGPYTALNQFTYLNLAGLSEEPATTLRAIPNPSNGNTFISLNTTEAASQAAIEVYDLSGRLVSQVYSGNVAANQEIRFQFDGSDLPQGIYLMRYTSNNEVTTEKMMISK